MKFEHSMDRLDQSSGSAHNGDLCLSSRPVVNFLTKKKKSNSFLQPSNIQSSTVKYTTVKKMYRQIYSRVPSKIHKKKKKHSTTKYTSFSRYREKYKKVPWEICDPMIYDDLSSYVS